MGVIILSQWVDIAQRLHVVRQHLRELRNGMLIDATVDTCYLSDVARITAEVKNLEQEVSYVYETLLQAQAALEYTGEWAKAGT